MALPFSREVVTDVAASGVASGIASAIAGEPVVMVGATGGTKPRPSPFTPDPSHAWPAGPEAYLQPHALRFPQSINVIDERTQARVTLVGPAVQMVYNPLSGKGIPPQQFIDQYPQYVVMRYPAPTATPSREQSAPPPSQPEEKPVGFVSTAFGGLANMAEGLLDFGADVLDFGFSAASRLAPIAAPFIVPTMATTAGRASAPTAPAAPVSYGGGSSVANYATALPGGAPVYLPGMQQAAGLGLPFIDIAPQGTVGNIVPRMTQSLRLPSRVDVPMPDRYGNVKYYTFKNMGRPLLYQGDLAACKRVRRVASRAKRSRGGR